MESTGVYVVGQFKAKTPSGIVWEFQGVFSTEAKAHDACRDGNYAFFPADVDRELPHETTEGVGYYPRICEAESIHQSAQHRTSPRLDRCNECSNCQPGYACDKPCEDWQDWKPKSAKRGYKRRAPEKWEASRRWEYFIARLRARRMARNLFRSRFASLVEGMALKGAGSIEPLGIMFSRNERRDDGE